MSSIRWTLFKTEIYEEIKCTNQESDDIEIGNDNIDKRDINKRETNKPKENSGDNNEYEANEVGVCDIVRNVFYTDMLKKINSDDRYFENKDSYIQRLNKLDSSLNIFMHSSKEILNSLDEEYTNIIGEENQRQQEAVYKYAEAVYKSINSKNRDIENIQELEREISEAFFGEAEIEKQFIEIRKLIVECALLDNSDSHRSKIVQRVYRLIRNIPLYLGSPYRERYLLYKKLQKYPKSHDLEDVMLHNSYDTSKIVNMLMVGSSFDSYYNSKYHDILNYIEKGQEEACSTVTIEFKDKFNEIIFNLNRLIMNSTKKVKDKYSKLDGGCFSIIDLYFKNGDVKNYICFSGLFDLSCKQNKFIKNMNNAKGLNEAIEKIAKTSEFSSSEIIKANRNIRYYYKGSYLTLCKICRYVNSGHETIGRMFSCCERKFYTILEIYDVSDVNKYRMFTKYNACPMCEDAINDFKLRGYVDEIIFGISKSFSKNCKEKYDKLAEDVSCGKKKIVL